MPTNTDHVHLPKGAVPDRSELRALLSGRALLTIILTLAVGAGMLVFAAKSGGTLANPVGHRVWEIGFIVTALGLLAVGVRQSIKERKLSRLFLITVASASAFWQETYGDWGAYVRYSDRFWTYSWGDTAFTGPVRCWWFIAGYVIFYGLLFFQMAVVVTYVRRRWPESNPDILAVLDQFPGVLSLRPCSRGLRHRPRFLALHRDHLGPRAHDRTQHVPTCLAHHRAGAVHRSGRLCDDVARQPGRRCIRGRSPQGPSTQAGAGSHPDLLDRPVQPGVPDHDDPAPDARAGALRPGLEPRSLGPATAFSPRASPWSARSRKLF